jgi:hypothetical protein
MFNAKTAIGANIYWSTLFAYDEFGIDGSFHFYPTGKLFFFGGAFGFHIHRHISGSFWYDFDWIQVTGVAITPVIGFKIDVGDPGGFFIQPGAKLPITLGGRTSIWEASRFGAGIGFVAYFALGYGF